MPNILNKLNDIVLSTMDTPEEAVRFFFKLLIEEIEVLVSFRPRNKESKVFPIKEKVIENRVSSAKSFIAGYEDFQAKISLYYADISRRFSGPKSIEIHKLLQTEGLAFREDLKKSFSEIRNSALEPIENLNFVSENYILTKEQAEKITSTISSLHQISKITYEKFILEIKKENM